MARWLRSWPPLVWLLVYTSSLFVLMGGQKANLLQIGLTLLLIAFGIAVYLAIRPEPGRPPPRGYAPLMAGLVVFYLISAAAAAKLGPDYAAIALLAGTVPMTAATLTYATARRKTRVTEDGRLVDESVEDASPIPGVGFDDTTPLGDSPELHDDIDPHDLPPGHPGRRVLEGKAPVGRNRDGRMT
ncbi:MAG: hypothetical protein QOI48_1024 [Solirubrobacteraceae bacterium]|nr:hypothetical protein [Solirubrobacteraceae bacterium]